MASVADISVVIVNWNTSALLKKCLETLYQQSEGLNLQVLVVDNNSPDDSVAMVKSHFPQVELFASPENLGFAKGNNLALEHATGRWILLLNPDTEVLDNALQKLLAFGESLPAEKTGVICSKLLNPDGSLQRSVHEFYSFWRSFIENRALANTVGKLFGSSNKPSYHWHHNQTAEIDWAFGAVMFFRKEVLDTIGGLDEQFYIYAEEMDYFLRVKKAGRTNWFFPEAEIIHVGGAASRQKKAKMFIENYKSFYLFLQKHYGSLGYLSYRLRAMLYLVIWYIRFSLSGSDEAKNNKSLYAETLRWHLSAQSWALAYKRI